MEKETAKSLGLERFLSGSSFLVLIWEFVWDLALTEGQVKKKSQECGGLKVLALISVTSKLVSKFFKVSEPQKSSLIHRERIPTQLLRRKIDT